jgi:hypothetical protein
VRHLCGNVYATRQTLKCRQIFIKGFPVPGHPLGQGAARNVLHAFHQADEPIVPVGGSRGEPHTTITHDHSGHTVPARGGHLLIPGGLTVVMRVYIDETRRHYFAGRVDHLARLAQVMTDSNNAVTRYRHIGQLGLIASTVHHGPAFDQNIVHRESLLLLRYRLPRTLERRRVPFNYAQPTVSSQACAVKRKEGPSADSAVKLRR